MSAGGQIYRGIPTGLLTSDADRKLLDSLGLRLILICAASRRPRRCRTMCRTVHGWSASAGFALTAAKRWTSRRRIGEKLLEGKPDEGRRMADAMYKQMLFGNKAYKELFRALEAGETPVLFHCSGGKDRTGVAAMLILLALGASGRDNLRRFRPNERVPPPGTGKDLGRARRGDRRPAGAEEVLSGHRGRPPRIGGTGALHHPQPLRQRRCLP